MTVFLIRIIMYFSQKKFACIGIRVISGPFRCTVLLSYVSVDLLVDTNANFTQY